MKALNGRSHLCVTEAIAKAVASPALARTALIATYIVALRGSNVMLLIVLSHLLSLKEYGELSAAYVIVTAGAQIVGAPLAALILRVQRSEGLEVSSRDAVLWWLAGAVPIVATGIYISHVMAFETLGYFNGPMLLLAALWMCAMGLELMSAALAIAHGRVALLAISSIVQATMAVTVVSVAVLAVGPRGLLAIPVCGAIAGAAVVQRTVVWSSVVGGLKSWTERVRSELNTIIAPTAMAAAVVTALSVALVAMAAGPSAHQDIALFGIGMQIVGISTFIPQVLANSALDAGHRAAREGQSWRKVLGRWTLLSAGVSLVFGVIVALGARALSLAYGDAYVLSWPASLACGALVAFLGPVNVLSHFFVMEGRQWLTAAGSFASTVLAVTWFALQPERSAAMMLSALLISNAFRCFVYAVYAYLRSGAGLYPEENRSKRSIKGQK